ncbi:efflux RND transporter permease subunit, partial [Desulfobotulus sp.]|uniref:efflux RND transporter permease subunit n=1 Tax=Desulfobotulus sp. TaxID=1940337 RepID=UPI002A35BF7C
MALSGEGYSEKELADYADYLRRELLKVADVSRIQIYGDRTETIEILIPEEQMALQGIRPDILTMALSRQNAVVDSGALDSGTRRVRLETTGVLTDLSTLENLILLGMDGRTFRLGDIATIQRSYQTPREKSLSINGKTAIGITISARQGANVVAMGEAVRLRMNQLMADMPLGMELHDVYYQSESVQKAIGKFMTSLIQSVGIVVLVLLFAMGVRSGLIIASGLVLSILASFLVMLAWGIDLQRISLAALILVMGMIVDNAIVVVDGTLIKLNQGMDRESAAVQSVKETAWPLLGATIIAVLAFFPIYMAPSNTGEYCASLFQVVVIALLASWV